MPAPRRTRRTSSARARPRPWDRFLQKLEEGATVSVAAKDAGFARRADVYEHRAADPEFAERWDDIVEKAIEAMEAEAYRRAVEGWTERGIYDDEGKEIGEVRKFSDALLIFMLKARRPDTYREQHRHEHVGLDGGPVNVRVELDNKQRKALGDVLRGRPASRSD